ncbi:MAG: macrolide transporter ATP-binding /permease protein [Candidatus Bathyarchaeota archaeon BA1]|nr:MAG: macrolide transporter ATP-binding /permease protein [Candidatus Bathyarchaeota archaeon BA1]
MRRKQIFDMAWENMKQRGLRTFLTTLGVVIGITAIIALASLGGGFRLTVKGGMQQGFEINVLTVMSGGILTGTGSEFTDEDIQNIKNIRGVIVASPLIQKTGVKLYSADGNKNSTAWVMLAVNFTEFWRIYPERLLFENGSLPEHIQNNTIVLGYNVQYPSASETFVHPGENITVQITLRKAGVITIKNYTFSVAGALEKSGAAGFINFDNAIFIPLETAKQIYEVDTADMVFAKIENPEDSKRISREIENSFQPRDVRVLVPITFMQRVESVLNMLETFLISIASVALLVAGLGIMNIMTVSVMERTREIGIIKAIGAKNRTVLTMFLSEAALIGLIGGVAGVPVGYAIAHVLGVFLFGFTSQPERSLITGTQPPSLSVTPILSFRWAAGAVIFGVIVSIIFGLYPARKAAKLDPVEALRYE